MSSLSLETKSVADVGAAEASVTDAVKIDPVEEKRVVRKIDWRMLPILGALYSFSIIDRSNLGLIYVAGAAQELQLTVGTRYALAIMVFFIPYIILELPSNLVVRRVGATKLLSAITILWGATMLAMGFVKTWQQLTGLRAVLGALEAGFFPACSYLISVWYTRSEMQFRLAVFYLSSILAGGFSPILAYGLTLLAGRNGLSGWRWVLVVEGIITMSLGIIAYPLIVDFPEKNRFLSPEETALVKRRIDLDRGDAEYDPITAQKLLIYASDFKIWVFAFLFFCSTVPSYAFTSFLPVILGGMGYNVRDSQLMAAPPYVVAVVVALIAAYMCDRVGYRGFFLVGQAVICLVGLIMTAYCTDNSARYAGTVLGLVGSQANVPCVLAYQSTNIVGQSKRAFSNAIVIAFGGFGGIFPALVFRSQDAPKYIPGLWATVGCQLAAIISASLMTTYFYRTNAATRAGRHAAIEGRKDFYYTI